MISGGALRALVELYQLPVGSWKTEKWQGQLFLKTCIDFLLWSEGRKFYFPHANLVDLFPPTHDFPKKYICLTILSKRFGVTAIGKLVGEAGVLTFRTKRTLDVILASPHQGTQSVLIFEPCLTCNKQNSWPKHPSGAVQRVMFYRSQAGIRAWPRKSNTPVWEGTGHLQQNTVLGNKA